MRKSLLAALIAASALIPAAALAQDGGDRRDRPDGRGGPQGQPSQAQRGDGGQRWQRRGGDQPQGQPPQQSPQPMARSDTGGRNGFDRRDGDRGGIDRGGSGRGGVDRDARPAPLPNGQPQDRGYPGDRRGDAQFQSLPGQQRGWNAAGRRDDDRRTFAGTPGRDAGARDGFRGDDRRGDDRRGDGRWGNGWRGADRGAVHWQNGGNRGWNGNAGAWNRDWRRDNRFNYGDYRRQNYGAYRLPRYYAPSGWGYGYRRFGVGFRLNSILFAQDYWIDDADAYRLPPAYGPYRWVRYYNDALLVDVRSGNVVDTVYDIFW